MQKNKYQQFLIVLISTGLGFLMGWIYGEITPLGHAGPIPPFFAIPSAIIGLLIGLLFARRIKRNFQNKYSKTPTSGDAKENSK